MLKEIITKYWLEFLLTGLGTAVIFFLKHHLDLTRKDFNEKMSSKIDEKINNNNDVLREELKSEVLKSEISDKNLQCEVESLSASVENLTAGVLSLQGKVFKNDCRALLEDGHIITLEEYEDIEEEHQAYNGLGGNHRGDALYKSVMKKWNAQITTAQNVVDETNATNNSK